MPVHAPGSNNSPALGLEAKISFNGLAFHDVNYQAPDVLTTLATNIVTNPSFEVDLAGWTTSQGVASRVNTFASFGSWAMDVYAPGLTAGAYTQILTRVDVQENQPYRLQAAVNISANSPTGYVQPQVDWYSASGSLISTESVSRSTAGATGLYSPDITFHAPAGASYGNLSLVHWTGGTGGTLRCQQDAICFSSTLDRGYFDGSTSPSGNPRTSWTGTPHASRSLLQSVVAQPVSVKADRYQLKQPPAGLRGTEIRDARQQNPSRDGETALIARRGGKTLTFTGAVHAGNLTKLRDMQTALDDATDDLQERPIIFTAPPGKGRSVMIYARIMSKDISDDFSGASFAGPFQLVFRASQSKFLSVDSKTFTRYYYDVDDMSSDPLGTRFTLINGTANATYDAGSRAVVFPSVGARSFYQRSRPSWGHRPIVNAQFTIPSFANFPAGRRFGLYALANGSDSMIYGVLENSGGTPRLAIYNRSLGGGTETLLASAAFSSTYFGNTYYMQFKPRALDTQWGSKAFLCVANTPFTRDVSLDPTPPGIYCSYAVSDEGEIALPNADYGIINEGSGGAVSLLRYEMYPMNVVDTNIPLTNDGTGQADLTISINSNMGLIPGRSTVKYTNASQPAGQRDFEFTGSWGNGVYTYDSRDGSLTLNGISQYDKVVRARNINLLKGLNTLQFTSGKIIHTAALQQTPVTFTWQDTWK